MHGLGFASVASASGKARRLVVSALICLLGLLCSFFAQAQSATSASTGSFPRIGDLWWGASLYSASPSEASQVQVFLGPQFSATQASAVRAADPNAAMLVDMNLMETTGGLPSVPSNYYLLDTNGNRICNWPGNPPNYILNMTNPDVARYVGQYAAQMLAQSGSAYNGVFFDNLIASIASKTTDCYGNPIRISSQGNGVADSPAALNAAWAAGLYTALSTFKSLAPGAYAVAHANQLPPDARSVALLNGDAFVFDVPYVREGKLAFGNLWDAYHDWFQSGQAPVLSAIQSSPPNQIAYGYGYTPVKAALPQTVAFARTFYPNMRFGLALSMMDNGYFIHDFGDNSSPVSWWYDEYNFHMGMPVAPYQLLGQGAGANQIVNGSFEDGTSPWLFTVSNDGVAAASFQIDGSTSHDGAASAHVEVTAADSAVYGIMLEQDALSLSKGVEYTIGFWARSDVYFPVHLVMQGGKPQYANYGLSNTITVGPGWHHYTVSFIASATAADARLEFQLGCFTGNVWLDSVKLFAAPGRIYRRDFQNGVVLLNGTNSPQTVSLEPGLARFSGSQAPRYQYIVDDNDPGFSASGSWTVHTFDTGWRKVSGPYYHAWNCTLHELDSSTGSAQWNLGIPADGQYTLQVWLPAAPTAGTWTTNAVYQVIQGGAVLATVPLDQTAALQGDQWFNLGTFGLSARQNPSVRVQNGGTGSLIADAVYVFSAVDRYNDGASADQVTLAPMDGILLQRETPTQSITFPAPAGQVKGTELTLQATASSGLEVGYSSNSPMVCQIAGETGVFPSTGTCSITARQAGGSGYTAAVPVTRSFPVRAPQTIHLEAPLTQILGSAPFAIAAYADSGLPVGWASNTQTICTVSGNILTLTDAGVCTITATQPGNSTYAPAVPVTAAFAVMAAQTITFAPLPLAALGGRPIRLSATSSSGLAVQYSTEAASNVCSVAGAILTLVAPGPCFVTASQPGSTLYAPAPPVTQSFTVVPNLLANGGFETSLSPWLFHVANDGQAKGTATIDNTQFIDGRSSVDVNTLHAATTSYKIDLEQASLTLMPGATYIVQFWAKADLAHSVQVEVQGAGPSYTLYGLIQTAKVGTSWSLYSYSFTAPTGATATSTVLPSPYQSSSTITDARLEFHFGSSAGNVWIDDVQLFGTAGMPQTITFPAVPNTVYGSDPVTLQAVSTSGLTVSFTSNTPQVCSATAGQVAIVGAGTCSITASQAGDATYIAATPVTKQFNVAPESQTIAFAALANQIFGVQPFSISASATSGLLVTFTTTTSNVCSVSGAVVSIFAAGTCSITASQGGNTNYAPAVSVIQSFLVAALAQSITFAPIGTQGMGSVPVALTASAQSGLPVTIASGTPSVCTVAAATATLFAPGTCSLTATQSGNAGYAPAPPVTQSFSVMPNLAGNGPFDAGTLTPWRFIVTADGSANAAVSLDAADVISAPASVLVNVASAATANWHIDLEQGAIPITAGKTYRVQFWARTNAARSIQVIAQGGSPGFMNYGLSSTVKLGTAWAQYTLTFTANTTAKDCRLEFYFGSAASSVRLDDVQFFAFN